MTRFDSSNTWMVNAYEDNDLPISDEDIDIKAGQPQYATRLRS